MRVFLLSDVHGNLAALNEVFSDMKSHYSPSFFMNPRDRTDQLGNLGDLVGYMPNPNEVVKKVVGFADFNLPGNHDLAVVDGDLSEFNQRAYWALSWTRRNITSSSIRKLRKICSRSNFSKKIDNAIFAHSTPYIPELMNYVLGCTDAFEGFFAYPAFTGLTAFVGHSHVPQFYYSPYNSMKITGGAIGFGSSKRQVKSFNLREGHSHLFVVPSVGQPRDKNPLSGYAVYDSEQKKVDVIRVPYNVKLTQDRMRRLNFLPGLVDRIAHGL